MRQSRMEVGKVALPAPGTIKCAAFIRRVIAPDATTKRPHYLSVFLLEDAEIPYVEPFEKQTKPKPKASNESKSTSPSSPPLSHKVGQDALLVSMFGGAAGITTGFYTINGLGYDWFTNKKGDTVAGCKCSSLAPLSLAVATALWKAIPFANRSFDLDLDIPNPDTRDVFGEDQPQKLVVVDICEGSDTPESIFGTFEIPVDASKCITSYETKEGRKVLALTGGPAAQGVASNQLLVTQRDGDSDVKILCLTKLHEDSLFKMGTVHWEAMAMVLIPAIRGIAFCSMDRAGTARLDSLDPNVVGTVAVGSTLMPDLAIMAPLMGFDLCWKSCTMLAKGRLDTPRQMRSDSNHNWTWSTAINILEFNGNIELIPAAMERGWIKIYVVLSSIFSKRGKELMRKTSDAEITTALYKIIEESDTGSLITIMYATLTNEAPEGFGILDYVSTARTAKAAKLFEEEEPSKRARVDENGEP